MKEKQKARIEETIHQLVAELIIVVVLVQTESRNRLRAPRPVLLLSLEHEPRQDLVGSRAELHRIRQPHPSGGRSILLVDRARRKANAKVQVQAAPLGALQEL